MFPERVLTIFFQKTFPMEWQGCCICSDSFSLTDITTLPCGHKFHSHCLSLWEKTCCPLCRARPDVDVDSEEEFFVDDDSLVNTEKSLPYYQAARRSCVRKSKAMCLKIASIKRIQEKLQFMRNTLKSIDSAISAVTKSTNERKRKHQRLHNTNLRLIQRAFKQDTLEFSQQRKKTLRRINEMQRSIYKHKSSIVKYMLTKNQSNTSSVVSSIL